jgi:SH3 domain protein
MVKAGRVFALLAAAALLSNPAWAEDVRYVSGDISLKMYADSALSKILPSLNTGDKVVILKRDDGYAQVKKEDGTTGWVKSSYLEKEKPAIVLLSEVQKELDDLRSKHTDLLLEQPEVVQAPDAQLKARVEAAEAAQQNMKLRMQELESERMVHIDELRELRQQPENQGDTRKLLLWVILPVLTLISGFFIGFKYLEGKVKSRFGGYNPL